MALLSTVLTQGMVPVSHGNGVGMCTCPRSRWEPWGGLVMLAPLFGRRRVPLGYF